MYRLESPWGDDRVGGIDGGDLSETDVQIMCEGCDGGTPFG